MKSACVPSFNRFNGRTILLCICVLAIGVNAATISITVDHTTRFQTIVGFGGRVFAAPQNAADVINDAGVSVVRLDWCASVNSLDAAKPYATAGCRTFIGTCWSPPAAMKDNNSLINGGSLLQSKYGEFGDWTVQQLQKFRTDYGVELYALSPQNEPRFAEPYGSCIYAAADLARIADTIARKIQAAGLHTKLFFADDLYGTNTYNRAFASDTALHKYITAFAYHGYTSDGVTPAQMDPTMLSSMFNYANSHGWQAWMSESEGDAGMQFAMDMIGCLRYGKVSLYSGVVLGHRSTDDEKAYMTGTTKNLTYYVGKCFNKFIRPGSVQLRSLSSDSTSFANFVTFYDPAASALIVSMVTTASAQSITLQGANLPATFQKWVASASSNCVNTGFVARNATVDIPANSVVTLFGTGYAPPAVGVAAPLVSFQQARDKVAAGTRSAFDLQGRRIGRQAALNRISAAVIVYGSGSRVVSRIGVSY